MSMPPGVAERLHREQEALAAQMPYDPTMATKVILSAKSESHKTTVWDRNPWDVFDRKVVLAYTGNKQRIALLKEEFARIGLDDVEVLWNFNSAFVENAFLKLTKETFLGRPFKPAIYNNALGHYAILKSSYELGCNSVLVMEDDIRFLRDVNLCRCIVESIPSDYEVAMLDSHPAHGKRSLEPKQPTGGHQWRPVEYMTSAGCYAVSRVGMEKFLGYYESNPLRSSDMYFDSEHFDHIYYCTPRAARQCRVSENTNTSYDQWSSLYDEIGCPRENYGQ